LLENPSGRTQRRTQYKQVVGHERTSMMCEAASCTCCLPLTSHTRSHTLLSSLRSSTQISKQKRDIYQGHQDQPCLASLVELLGTSRRTVLSMERSRTGDLVFSLLSHWIFVHENPLAHLKGNLLWFAKFHNSGSVSLLRSVCYF